MKNLPFLLLFSVGLFFSPSVYAAEFKLISIGALDVLQNLYPRM